MSPTRVLFVCLGNICRSPLAEGAFRSICLERGLTIETGSAGTRNWHEGKAPDKRSIAIAKKHGVDISAQRARPLVPIDFTRFSHIVGMDDDNLRAIRGIAPPAHHAALSLLLDHAPGMEGQGIADPWSGRAADFEETWRLVTLGATGLVEKLATAH